MKKFIKGNCYKQPELDVDAKYRFSIRRAAICDDVVQLFIEARLCGDVGLKDREFFLEEITTNSQLFRVFIAQMYSIEEGGIIEVNAADFTSFSCYGYIEVRPGGDIGINWRTIELEENPISKTGLFYEEDFR